MKKRIGVFVVIGAGHLSRAIIRRIGVGRNVVLADTSQRKVQDDARTLQKKGYLVEPFVTDLSSLKAVRELARIASSLGAVKGLVCNPDTPEGQHTPEVVYRTQLYATSIALEVFRDTVCKGGAGVVIASRQGHCLSWSEISKYHCLATLPSQQILEFPLLNEKVADPLMRAVQLAEFGKIVRVKAESAMWGKCGARLNSVSVGKLYSPEPGAATTRGDSSVSSVSCEPDMRITPDEIANVVALLMGIYGQSISGSDFLIDGGLTSLTRYGSGFQPAT